MIVMDTMSDDIINDSGIVSEKTFHCSDIEEDIGKTADSKHLLTSCRILLVKDVAQDSELVKACQIFNVPISVVDGLQCEHSEEVLTVYIVNSFDNVHCNGPNYKILGRTALLELAKKVDSSNVCSPFFALSKPLYCHALSGQVICFTGFKRREELFSLKLLIHHMGGRVRKETNSETTHLVAKICKGEKYSYAMLFNVPVVSETWLYDAWEKRNVVGFNAADSDFVSKYKLKLFHGSKVCFLGFPEEEKNHMIEVLKENGGEPVDLTDINCTHMVTDESFIPMRIFSLKNSHSNTNPNVLTSTEQAVSDSSIPPKKIKICFDDKENAKSNGDSFTAVGANELRQKSKKQHSLILRDNSNILTPKIENSNSTQFLSDISLNSEKANNDVSVCKEAVELSNELLDCHKESLNDAHCSMKNVVSPSNYNLMLDNDGTMMPSTYFSTTVLETDTSQIQSDHLIPNILSTDFPVTPVSIFRREKLETREMVVDETKITAAPPPKSYRTFIVKADWFWSSIQYDCRKNELDFRLDDISQQINNSNNNNVTPVGIGNPSLYTTSSSRARKRKILKEKFSFGGDQSPQSAQKRRSSVSDVTRLSEDSFLDYTFGSTITNDDAESVTSEKSKHTKRYYKFVELWQTETNYVGILRTIMTLFKGELEAMVDKKEQLLNATELKIIFGHLPPIYTTHCSMLEELTEMAANWSEESSIGSLIQKYSGDLVKAYPPFINFFETTRDMLIKCDKTKPRFHAFLKLRQSKPECGRQSLQDLLIRPVQRLPSIYLLLNDILRNTPKNSVDYSKLEIAIDEIQKVMTYINEDKKRTEGQVALFDIFNEIEKCPADLVSSHRCFISRCEVTELSDDLSGKGNPLVLFLFSDVIEVCKKRKAFSKENNGTTGSKHGNVKLYKHVELIPLSAILRVVDIKETEDCHNIFALIVKKNHDLKELENGVYSFTITDNTVEKFKYLRSLCNQIANVVCTTDTESYLTQLEPQELDIDSSEVTTGALGKAFNKFASKTRVKVGRALSFNKTPNKLKRAMSTMMSPFGSQNGLTPSSQLAGLQLVALPPIPNYGDDSSISTISGTPNSGRPVRKHKSSSFSMGSLRRL